MVGLSAMGYVVAIANGGRSLIGWTLRSPDVLCGHLETTIFAEDYEVEAEGRVTTMTRQP